MRSRRNPRFAHELRGALADEHRREAVTMRGEHGKRDGEGRLLEVQVPHAEGDAIEAYIHEDGVMLHSHDPGADEYAPALSETRYTPTQARQLAQRLMELAFAAEQAGYGSER